ncbi:hypothetical protein FA95DRAFT_1570146 [Auriscalpium vulgare]|uniref:Uncharacterized protein n=1 Tax=Auriscalpium vulgare TaxID=40419 RepID=A0ACB8S4R2_9AGAM|nr:hypothetical protein FA95DRAFT_1570146 [Auriscalpium vulgare]
MSASSKLSVFVVLLLALAFSAHATLPGTTGHGRRSLAFKKKLHRDLAPPIFRAALGDGDLLSNVVRDDGGGTGAPTTGAPDTGLPSTGPPATVPPPSSTTPPTSSPSDTSPPTSSDPPQTSDAPVTTSAPPPSTTAPPDTQSSAPASSTQNCLFGIDILGLCLPEPPKSSDQPQSSTDPASSTAPTTSDPPPSTTDPASSTAPTTSDPPPSTTDPASSAAPTTSDPPPSTTAPPDTQSSASASSTQNCLFDVLGLCLPPPTSSNSPQSSGAPSSSGSASQIASITTTAPSLSVTGVVSSQSDSQSQVSQSLSFSVSGSITDSQSVTGSITASQPVSGSITASQSVSGSITASQSVATITFPSGISSTVSASLESDSTITSDATSSFTLAPQSQLSYVTETTLLFTSVPTSSAASQSDPDAPATTLSLSAIPSSASQAPLPSDLASRIYPPGDTPSPGSDYTLISVLFDSDLSWEFVANNVESQGQLFLWFPAVVQAALGIPADQTLTFALQVYVPSSYQGPDDVAQLLTTFLMWIPKPQVSTLANMIKVQSSPFYTTLGPPYSVLAQHVDAAFSITSVQDPNSDPGSGNNASGSSASTGGSSSNNKRTDTIIGVVSALGGLTLIILGILIFRSIKHRRELAHRRLSDPVAAYPDRSGRDFDQDSVGGQRRRSFYFAEDSLRGGGPAPAAAAAAAVAGPSSAAYGNEPVVEYSYRNSPDQMRERRPVVPGAISAPILQQSSLNW